MAISFDGLSTNLFKIISTSIDLQVKVGNPVME